MMTKQTYNFVAKRIREEFPTDHENDTITLVKRGTLVDLSLRCALGFLRNNPNFQPLEFLEACSPDKDKWPIQELWEDFLNGEDYASDASDN
jgi:hypothetical protein